MFQILSGLKGQTDDPEDIEVTVGEELEASEFEDKLECRYSFVFLVDKAGSNRLEMTKRALILFMQSLPEGSQF